MIRSLVALPLLALLASCGKERADPVEPPPVADTSLTITTWNLQWFPGKRPGSVPPAEEEAHIASVAQVLADLDPDILCVQGSKIPPLSGDFNHDPGQEGWAEDDTFRILGDAGFIWAGEGQPREETVTWLSNGRYPDAAFDHFLVRPAQGGSVGRATSGKTGRDVSDHRPLTRRVVLP